MGDVFELLHQSELQRVCVQFGYEFPFVKHNKVMSEMSSVEKSELDGRITFERPWVSPNTKMLDKIADSLDRLNKKMKKQEDNVKTLDNWARHIDESLEVIGTQVAMKHENDTNSEDYVSEFDIGRRGYIWACDNKNRQCQLDGLFNTKDGDFFVVEAKMYLTEDQLKDANETYRKFSEYLESIRNISLLQHQKSTKYGIQVSAFKSFEKHPEIRKKYLIFNLSDECDAFSAKSTAIADGWTLITRDEDGYEVLTP